MPRLSEATGLSRASLRLRAGPTASGRVWRRLQRSSDRCRRLKLYGKRPRHGLPTVGTSCGLDDSSSDPSTPRVSDSDTSTLSAGRGIGTPPSYSDDARRAVELGALTYACAMARDDDVPAFAATSYAEPYSYVQHSACISGPTRLLAQRRQLLSFRAPRLLPRAPIAGSILATSARAAPVRLLRGAH